jgi:hypothetical protein
VWLCSVAFGLPDVCHAWAITSSFQGQSKFISRPFEVHFKVISRSYGGRFMVIQNSCQVRAGEVRLSYVMSGHLWLSVQVRLGVFR